MWRQRLARFGLYWMLIICATLAHGQESLSFHKLEEALSHNSPVFQATNLLVQGQRERLGHLRRSFVPQLSLAVGQEEFGSDRLGRHSSAYYWAEGEVNLFNGYSDYWEEQAREARVKKESFSAALEQKRVLSEVRKAYIQVATLKRRREAITDSLSALRSAAAKASRKIKAGVITQSDAVALSLLAQAYEDKIFRLDEEILQPLSVLRVHLGQADLQADAIEVGVLSERLVEEPAESQDQDLLEAQRLRKESQVLDLQSKSESGKRWPSLDVVAGYGRPSYSEREIEVVSERQEWRVGLQATLELGDFFEHQSEAASLRAQSQAKSLMAELNKRQGQASIDQLQLSVLKLQNRLDGLQERQRMTGRYYRMVLDEYLRGVKGTSDLSSALNQFLEAETKKLDLLKQLRLAEIELLRLM